MLLQLLIKQLLFCKFHNSCNYCFFYLLLLQLLPLPLVPLKPIFCIFRNSCNSCFFYLPLLQLLLQPHLLIQLLHHHLLALKTHAGGPEGEEFRLQQR